MKKKKIDLNLVTIHTSSSVSVDHREHIEDTNEDCTEFINHISGEIKMYDFSKNDNNDTITIGKFQLMLLWGTDEMIYESLDNHSFSTSFYSQELYEDSNTTMKDEYYNLAPDVFDNRFLIIENVEIDKEYRGRGIIKKLIETLNITYCIPMVLKPFPLQYEGTFGDEEVLKTLPPFEESLKKVINSYKKCGFKKPKRNSQLMVRY